jgi:hypothetical protein
MWTARRVSRPRPVAVSTRLSRRFEFQWFEDGEVYETVRLAPALPIFEQAFGAFTHGNLIQTSEGPVAVEDLQPGMFVECSGGNTSQLIWKGAITIVPGAPSDSSHPDKLYRVMSDAFGLGRPVQDQTFGPHARRLDRNPKMRSAFGTAAALLPLSALADGASVIEVTPVSPTRVYHLVCESHETILAAGLEVESYHPGPEAPISLSDEMMRQFMDFFPHLHSIRDFGRLAAPRISADEIAAFT